MGYGKPTMILGYTQVVGWDIIHSNGKIIGSYQNELDARLLVYVLEDSIEIELYSYQTIEAIRRKHMSLLWRFKRQFPDLELGKEFTIRPRRQYIKYYVPKKANI